MQKKSRINRILSLILCCIMVIQMLPLNVFAVETSDICGRGVSWRLDGDVLYIEGEGETYDFLNQWDTDDDPEDTITLPPWIGKSVTKIVVGEGVTYIGNKAFYEMNNVVEVELPSTLKGIGNYAFAYMEKLEEVILPEGLTTMGESAFQVCHSMETLYIPSTLKVIPYNAFWECTSLTDLTISEGVEEIGEGAFNGCTGLGYESENGDLNNLFDRPGLQYVEIPGSVKTIGSGAFASCTMLREVVLHEGIERIGGGAFQNCNSLYDVTLPASLKTMGEWVFTHMGGSLDFKLQEQGIPTTNLQNVYILSRVLSLKATEDYDTDAAWFNESNTFTMFHVYEDSVAASELEQYNLKEYHSSYIPDCGHELEAFVSDGENTHTRTCTEDGCTASQTVRHTLTVDLDNLTMGDCETALRYRMRCTACDYVGEFITKEAAGHEISGNYYNHDEDFHEGYCWKCSQYVLKPHEWEYDEDPTATEPYEVEAYCADCGTTKVITVLPAEATIISVKAEDENGDDATLPEDAFTVRWEDSEGNLLDEGTTYVHEQGWLVTEDTPVFAVVSFSDEVREAYSTGSEYRHKVTVLGERTEFVLVPRETLTVTGRVMVDGYTYPPVDWLSLTLTTEIAGNETVVTVTPNNSGYFTAEIRRASTRLDYAALGYERVVLENVQMMPAADGVIDVGTLTLVNQMAWYYPTVESSDYAAVAEKLVGASLIAVNERTGEEYTGARIERHDDFSLAISFGMDMDEYFMIGDSVTIRCAQMDEVIFDPYTFTITRQDEQVPLVITVYKAPKLEITLNRYGHIFLFDSEDNLVFDVLRTTYSSFLPRDTYTLVAIEQNYRVPTIDSPDALEQMGIPSEYYLKETINLNEDVTLERELPYFYYGGDVAIAASFDRAMQTDGLVPMYLNFNHLFKETYAEGETIEFTFSASDLNALPVESIGGTYAFGADELGLTERIVTDRTDSLVVTTNQPRGTIMLYVKPTGESLIIHAKISSGTRDYLKLKLPEETSVRMIDPTPSGWTTNADHFVTLYTKLPTDQAPYNGYLYVNGELKSEKKLNITGDGRNYLPYTLERYDDGASTHDLYVEIMDKDGELVWTSENYMVTLTNRTMYNTVPQELTIRIDWEAQRQGLTIVKKIDLQKNPGASFNVAVNESKINADGTLTVDAVFDYALRMSDNKVAIKDNTVYMKVFCGEDYPVPTIHDIKLRYNGETGTYDGSLTLEAGTYTVRDLPYGYSFDYSMAGGGSSNSVPVGSAYGVSYSTEQLVDEMEDKAANYIAVLESEPYEYYDPDDVEFAIENMEGLTDEEKQMMRTLLSISNDFYRLQQEAQQSSTAAAQEMIGGSTISDSPAEGIQDIMSALGDDIVCEPTDLTADDLLFNTEYIEVNTSKIGDDLDMVLDSFYMKTDVESLRTSVVDPNNGIEYTVNHSGAVSGDEGGASFKEALKKAAGTFYGGAVGALDVALDATEKVRKYFDNELTKKLGLETSAENFEETIEAWKKSLDEIEGRVHNIEWGDNYEKSILEAQRKTLDDILEIRQTRNAIAETEQTLKSLRAELISTKLSIENCERVAGSKFLKYLNKLSKFDNIYVKFTFTAVDVYSLLVTIKNATMAFDTCIENYNRLQFAQEQADRMKEALTSACPGGDAYYTQWDKCSEAHRKLMDAIGEAEDWNKNLLYVKYGQVIGELASIAAGFALKGPQGVIVSLGIGILGGGSEWFALEQFYDALEEITKLQPEVESACLEASQDPSITDGDCDDDDDDGNGGDEDDGHDGIPGYSNGLGICEEPQYPVKTNPTIDPAGYVYEAVASNRIEGATAKIYYEKNGEEVYWSEAEDYGEVNPQTTDMDGRFAWMTPIGNWLVKVEKEGYENADSKNDPAAVDGWLPVPPPQLDVNIAMTPTAAPTVLSVGAASDQLRVVFSQYMDIAQMEELVTVTQNGQPIPVDILFEDAEVSPTNSTVYYGRIMKLTRTDGAAFGGDGIVVTVAASAQNYAGTALGDPYSSGAMTVTQLVGSLSHSYPNRFVTDVGKTEQIAVQVLDTNGKPMAGVTVTARQIVGGTLSMTESAVSDANGTAVFTAKGLSAGSDAILFSADVVSTEMNTRVAPLGNTAPQKPTANLTDYEVVAEGTQLVLDCDTEGAVIYYTTNNTCPCTDSAERKIYDGPIAITEDTFFRIASWTEAGGYSERLNLHITIKKDIHHCKDNLTKVDAKPADCTVDGNIEYYTCSCGKWFEDANASVEIADKDSVVIKAGHIYGALIEEIPAIHTATELKAGMKAHYFCDECDTYLTAEKVETTEAALVIPAPVHDYATVNGYKEADGHADTCSCGAHNTVVGHTPNIPAATETEDQKCSVCGYVLATATGHMHTNHLTRVEAKPADCTVDGNIEYWSCSCGKYFEDATASVEITDKDSVIIKAGHEYGTLIAEVPTVHTATELKSGMKAHYFCDKCDTYFTAEKVETTEAALVIPAPVHDYATVNGYKEADGHANTCSCGAHDTVVGHTPDIPAATETEDQKCSVCGYVLATATGNSVNLVTVVGSYASITGDGEYEAGETVTVYAGSRSGYSFNGWTSSDVSITNAINATASFVMPDHAVTVTANWTKNSSGGGGGAYVPASYTNTAVAAKNGNVSVSPKSAVKGETVTVTIAPDKGYTLETLTATDKNGKEIELTNKGDGKYTFKMPASKVTVEATFMDDNTMLNFFVDVPADAYYYDAVLWAVKEGITNGTSATTFSPGNPCTRAQMATFLWRAAGSPDPASKTCPFVDVAADAYYAKAVQWAYEQGITGGTSATTYSPDETCTRGQMATFLWRNTGSQAPVNSANQFADVPADKYYATAVQWAYEQKITTGTGAMTFSPNDPCTRAQMVTFLYRYFVK